MKYNIEQLLPILLSKDYKEFKPVFPVGGIPRELSSSWFQFFHDVVQLNSGLRDCYLIDYSAPEFSNLSKFIKAFKLKLPDLLKNLSLLVVNDFQYFLIDKVSFVNRLKYDVESNFGSYMFVDVSPCLECAAVCKDAQYHRECLKSLAAAMVERLEKEDIPSKKMSEWFDESSQVGLLFKKMYPPILSGWLCNYPVIYCNSADCAAGGCSSIPVPITTDTESKWNANCITMTELTRYELLVDRPLKDYQQLNSIQSLKRIQSFTVPSMLLRDDNNNDNNTINQILNQWIDKTKQRQTELKRKIWETTDIKVTKVSNTTVNL